MVEVLLLTLERRGASDGFTRFLGWLMVPTVLGFIDLPDAELKVAGALRRLAAFSGEGGCCKARYALGLIGDSW